MTWISTITEFTCALATFKKRYRPAAFNMA